MQKIDIYGLGNPLIDMFVQVDELTFSNLGLKKNHMNLVDVNRQNELVRLLGDIKPEYHVGGSCANTMVTISQLGGKTAYCGKVGSDKLADEFGRQLNQWEVDSRLKQQDGDTGSTLIIVTPDAARTMNTHLGMSQHLSKEDIDVDAIANSKYLYIEGYLWDTPSQKEAVLFALEVAKKNGTQIALSLSDPFCVQRHKTEFQQLLDDYVDLLFCNEDEAMTMTNTSEVTEAKKVLLKSVSHLVLTLGKEGVFVCWENERYKIPAYMVQAVDTTGAGDAFAAGYLFGITRGYDQVHSGIIGSYCAARIVSQLGARFFGDLRKEITDFFYIRPIENLSFMENNDEAN